MANDPRHRNRAVATKTVELVLGIASLPAGKRRKVLAAALDEKMIALFAERIVAFDTRAAETYPRIVIRARRHGHPIAVADAQIASIAASRQFSLATRDVAPFQAAGVPTINPWTAQPEPESRGRRRTKPQP